MKKILKGIGHATKIVAATMVAIGCVMTAWCLKHDATITIVANR